jgi:tRNA(Ile)-lysidine synthase TilS/MesJ
MVKEARKLGFNKIATGHHIDDAIETLFMNMINEGRISTFSPITFFDRNDIHLIRPFCLLKEEMTIKVAKKLKIPIIKNSCPNETTTQRNDIKKMLDQVFYKNTKFKYSYKNFQVALLNSKQSNL